jgi:hypothetical protein
MVALVESKEIPFGWAHPKKEGLINTEQYSEFPLTDFCIKSPDDEGESI